MRLRLLAILGALMPAPIGHFAGHLGRPLLFLPIWTGAEIPRWFMTLHFWFPSWV